MGAGLALVEAFTKLILRNTPQWARLLVHCLGVSRPAWVDRTPAAGACRIP